MKQYHNKDESTKIGAQIRALRKGANFSINDIAQMTGFTQSLLSAVENGAETNTSHLIEIAKAIGVHPMEIFNVPFILKPRNELSSERIDRNMLTYRITKMCDESDFFNSPQFVKDILEYLEDEYQITASSTSVAGVMRRLLGVGKLKSLKKGRQNQYFKEK